MHDAVKSRRREVNIDLKPSRSVNIFQDAWLQSFGYAFAALYLVYFVILYRAGTWIVNAAGSPIYSEFTPCWVAGLQALHGNVASLADPDEFLRVQNALLGTQEASYICSYPPIFLLVLTPLALLPYAASLLLWQTLTLLGCASVLRIIGGRPAAVALMLASPFTAWNFLAGQNGFFTTSLLGASLLFLERSPILAGAFMGCLTYKPQFGILLPVALAASKQWRAFASAAATTVCLAGVSIVAFGVDIWPAFLRKLARNAGETFVADPDASWGYLQTVYGLIRGLHGSATSAELAQGATTIGVAAIVWFVWRSRAAYPIKAAILSAAALLATPYAFAYDLAAIAIPAAFLANDQLSRGLLRGDKAVWIMLFGAPLALLVTLGDNVGRTTFGGTPVGLLAVLMLFGTILRRAFVMRNRPLTPPRSYAGTAAVEQE